MKKERALWAQYPLAMAHHTEGNAKGTHSGLTALWPFEIAEASLIMQGKAIFKILKAGDI
jgi:hypothetical protein